MMKRSGTTMAWVAWICAAAGLWGGPMQQAADPHAAHKKAAHHANDVKASHEVKLTIPDVAVVDQDGNRIRFYSDLVRNRVVVINFLFTTCTTICPPLSATFVKVQQLLGDRAKDVQLISVSVDPLNDTPARMKAWMEKFRARSGWSFVSGGQGEIVTLLRALGAYTSRKEDHTPMVLVGNDTKGAWTRTYGIASAPKLVQLIEAMH